MVHSTWAIILAGGKSEQLNPEVIIPFLYLGGKPILVYSLQAFEHCMDIDGIVLVVDKDRMDSVKGMVQMFGGSKVKGLIPAASNRQASVINAMKVFDDDATLVCIHDASRPGVTSALISETIKATKRYGSGVAAVPLKEGIKVVEKGHLVKETVEGESLWVAQSPQTFKKDLLVKGYDLLAKKKQTTEDDSLAFEKTKEEVHLVESTVANMRIRTVEDLQLAACFVKP